MTTSGRGTLDRRGRGTVFLALALAMGALSACSDLLEVELPSSLTDDVLTDPNSASTQVGSIIANIECGYSAFGWVRTLGAEGVLESVAGRGGGHAVHGSVPDTGSECDAGGDSSNGNYYDQFQIARAMAYGTYERLENWTDAEVREREQLMATTALYAGVALEHFGTYYCEMTFDNSALMTPSQVMDLAEEWINRALGHIGNTGDYEISHGASNSARTMAMALRARIRWHNGDHAGAAADAAQIPMGYSAWIVRDPGPQRRNKIYESGTQTGWGGMLGINDWWNETSGVTNRTNPVTGSPWPDPIPFTGYLFLGIMPDGRAVDDNGYAVTYAEEFRATGAEPTLLNNGAVPDVRVRHFKKSIQGPEPREVPDRYTDIGDDIPLVDWEEIWLILAEIEGGQQAIDRVNAIRRHYSLPEVTYADPGNAEQIRHMIIEERRRSFFAEGGRFWATKILNTDILWFPRTQGLTPSQGYDLNGGVRLVMPGDEYTLNPNINLDDRATGCSPDQAPTQDPDWSF